MYMSATTMKPDTIDHRKRFWSRTEPYLGHLYIEQVDTSAIDELKRSLPEHLGPEWIHNRTKVVRAVLRFMWKMEHLLSVPYVPMESAPEWDTEQERAGCIRTPKPSARAPSRDRDRVSTTTPQATSRRRIANYGRLLA